MVRGSVGVMVVMSSYFAHNYFLHVIIANTKVLRMNLILVSRSQVCLIIIDYFMNEFTFKVLKACIFTCFLGFVNDIHEVAPLRVAHQFTKFPCAPAFHIAGNACHLLKLMEELSYFFLFHHCMLPIMLSILRQRYTKYSKQL